MSRPMARLNRLETQRRLLISAADLHRGRLARSVDDLRDCSYQALQNTRIVAERTHKELASAGRFVATAAVLWSALRAVRRGPRPDANKTKTTGVLSRLIGFVRMSGSLWSALRTQDNFVSHRPPSS